MLLSVLCGLQLLQVLLHCGQITLNSSFADPGPLRPALETSTDFTAQGTSLSYNIYSTQLPVDSHACIYEYYKLCYSMVVGDFFSIHVVYYSGMHTSVYTSRTSFVHQFGLTIYTLF